MPACFGDVESVRASRSPTASSAPRLVHTFWPVQPPLVAVAHGARRDVRRGRSRRPARRTAGTRSPRRSRIGGSQRAHCSGVACVSSVGPTTSSPTRYGYRSGWSNAASSRAIDRDLVARRAATAVLARPRRHRPAAGGERGELRRPSSRSSVPAPSTATVSSLGPSTQHRRRARRVPPRPRVTRCHASADPTAVPRVHYSVLTARSTSRCAARRAGTQPGEHAEDPGQHEEHDAAGRREA